MHEKQVNLSQKFFCDLVTKKGTFEILVTVSKKVDFWNLSDISSDF